MKSLDMKIEVGKRNIEDTQKIGISGRLIQPDSKSDKLILFASGVLGKYPDYDEFFGRLLGNEFNIYITELRNKGWTSGDNLKADYYQIDKKIRDIVETNKVIYVGHSMGMNVAVATKNEYNTSVDCFYGICAYPSFSDSRTKDEDITRQSLQQKVVSYFEKLNIGPLGLILKEQPICEPSRFAIGGNDEVVNTRYEKIAKRFEKYLNKFNNSTVKIFPGRNHCFNYKPNDFAPFNKNDPNILVDDIKKFIHQTYKS